MAIEKHLSNILVDGTISKVGGTTSQILMADGSILIAGAGITISGGLISATLGATDTTYCETPTGTVNGTNTVFTLTSAPSNTAAVIVLLDGIPQYNGIDFTVSGATITFTTAPANLTTIFVYYNLISGAGSSGSTFLKGTSILDFGNEGDNVINTISSAVITNANINMISLTPTETVETSLDDFTLNGVTLSIENIIDNTSFDIRGSATNNASGNYTIKYSIGY